MTWNHFDIVAALLILLVGLKGLYNGAIRELSGLIGVALGIFVASQFASSFGAWASAHLFSLGSSSAMSLLAFLFLLFSTWIVCIFLGVLIVERFEPSFHTWADRLVGFLFASIKIFIILSVIVYALSTIEFIRKNAEPYLADSRLYPLFITTGQILMPIAKPSTSPQGETSKKAAHG